MEKCNEQNSPFVYIRGQQTTGHGPNSAMPILFHILYGGFHSAIIEQSSGHRDHVACKTNTYSLTFLQKKLMDPWCRRCPTSITQKMHILTLCHDSSEYSKEG